MEDKPVHEGKEEVCQLLRWEVTNGHAVFVEKTLGFVEPCPKFVRAALLTIELRLVTDGYQREVDERIDVATRVVFADERNEERKQHLLVY